MGTLSVFDFEGDEPGAGTAVTSGGKQYPPGVLMVTQVVGGPDDDLHEMWLTAEGWRRPWA